MASRRTDVDEDAPLLAAAEPGPLPLPSPPSSPSASLQPADADQGWTLGKSARRLYASHLLSTCNSRVFEFGSVLYLAAIFPSTLLPMSVYALARGAAAIVFSSLVGQYIDREDRLKVVRLSIVSQRLAVAASCLVFYLLARMGHVSPRLKMASLAVLVLLACVEKLASIMNLVSVERDWVIVVAQHDQAALRTMNSQMRRIDLICKLFGPFFISIIDSVSTEAAILVNLGMNMVSVIIEYFSIAKVYHQVPELQRPKPGVATEHDGPAPSVSGLWHKAGHDMRVYFNHRAFLPSFAASLLHFTVLSFSGQMITYLLSTGYASSQIGVARTVSVAFEVMATWIAPWLMTRIGPIRAALWFSSWQVLCLMAGMAICWAFSDNAVISALGLVGGTVLSRVGLWGFDLSSQIIIQEDVDAETRGAFAAVEASWQNLFAMCSYASTMVLSSPAQFRWPATASVGAVAGAWLLYSRFVSLRRGHLLHWPPCMAPVEKQQPSAASLLEAARPRHEDGF